MAERLRKIAELPLSTGIILFRKQTEVVAQGEQMLEQRLSLVQPAHHRQRVDEPEAADEERSFAPSESVRCLLGPVAENQPVLNKIPLNRFDCADHPNIVRWQEADRRNQ